MKPIASLILILLGTAQVHSEIVISEIMYHPASELTADEFIELSNTGAEAVDLSGWAFASGIGYTFPPSTVVAAGDRLVVAADVAAFAGKYPGVSNFVGGWVGRLSNSSNGIVLVDGTGTRIDSVDYADDGDWGIRRNDWWSDFGHKGLNWDSSADGVAPPPPYANAPADILARDRSLELIHEGFDNSSGQNWRASEVAGGTPGTVNSVAAPDIAPVISDVAHFPPVPKSTDPVWVTARVLDDLGAPPTVTAHWRIDGTPTFATVPMLDDGLHGDLLAGDGLFGASLPSHANGTIIEFHISASDGTLERTWPAPVVGDDSLLTPAQLANCLYQVDDSTYNGVMPVYRLIMKAADKVQLAGINANGSGGSHPYPYYTGETNDQTRSHARFNASFIAIDGTGASVRYRVSVRNRGNGSRNRQPQGLNVTFTHDRPWNGVTQFNLNSQYTPWQVFGATLFARSGVPSPQARAVQVRWNGSNPAGNGSPSYGFYACNEAWNSDLIDNRFPRDSSGNLYRSVRLFEGTTAGGTPIPNGGDFAKITPGGAETRSLVDLYKLNYRKQTNSAEDEWSDLIGLTEALAKGQSGSQATSPVSWDADYATAVSTVADVDQWMRWFAVNTMVDNNETNLSNADGDDFHFYFGVDDPRCRLMPYDLDTILGGGDSAGSPTAGLFRMISRSGGAATPMNAFMKHPDFAPRYYAALKSLLDGPFKPSNFNALADQSLGGLVDPAVIDSMKSFNTARHTHVSGQVPLAISVTTAPALTNGYPRSLSATTTLGGKANAITTRSVKVNGIPAGWNAQTATWSATGVALQPGINRLLIQAFDAAGAETEIRRFEVWYDDGSVATVVSPISSDTTWTATGGPYSLTTSVTIAAGATLTIEPGTTIYLGSAADLIVANGGRIIANGTAEAPIRFTRTPGAPTTWGGIIINGSSSGPSPLTEIRHAHLDFNGDTAIHAQGGDLVLENVSFGTTNRQYLSLDDSSFLVADCVFPDATPGANFELVHGTGGIKPGGRGILVRNFFGYANSVTGDYNDVVDFAGGQRPGPILQVIDNVFTGSGDDILDLDGTDAWIEGNIFLHVHKNGSPDSASAISGGNDGALVSRITIVGNLFFDVDHAATAKQGNQYAFLNNTVVKQTTTGGDDTDGGVLNLADEGTTAGAGYLVENNILLNCEKLVRNYSAVNSTVVFNDNHMTLPWSGPGTGNRDDDPLLRYLPSIAETDFDSWAAAQVMKSWFSLRDGSPAIGAGPNGRDKGGAIPRGVCLTADAGPVTAATQATFTVGPLPPSGLPWSAGHTHYIWRLDEGPWSAETPIVDPILLTGLTTGTHRLEVAGKNDAQYFQNDPAFGSTANVAVFEWEIDPAYIAPGPQPIVRINEVLAKNSDTLAYGTVFPDWIELHNAGNITADLGDWGLSDDPTLPYKYLIAPGTTLEPGAYLVIHASVSASVPLPRTGFALSDNGETLTLTRDIAGGGGAADTILFGRQLPDYSLGRRAVDGGWDLCQPTFGTANVVAARTSPSAVSINEWLASAGALSTDDFIELHNSATLPADLGGCFLTDNLLGWPDRHQITPHSFVGAGGHILFKADGDPQKGADHLAFKLSALQGEIALLDADLGVIDHVLYGPQSTDVSEGRSPDGSDAIVTHSQPTPGGPNPGSTVATSTVTVNLIPVNASWKYRASTTSYHGSYQLPAFDDSAWPSGGQLLHYETSTISSVSGFTKITEVPRRNGTAMFPTYYFRTRFNYDGPAQGVILRATAMIDDAAVIYLNGQVAAEIRMTAAGASYSSTGGGAPGSGTEAREEIFYLPAELLIQGENVIAVEVHQVNSTSSDMVWGLKLDALIETGQPASSVVIGEILANNVSLTNPDSSLAPWVELFNPADEPADISDMSLSDTVLAPRAWVMPAGSVIPAGGRLVIQCDATTPVSATNTGFTLNPAGGGLHLFHALASGGGLRDSVTWGNQLPDLSIGRVPDATGAFTLNTPTRGEMNSAQSTGPLTAVRINEWVAAPASGPDWFELYNPGALPVMIGGSYLTDALANPTKQRIAPLSFIAAGGWVQWIADNNAALPGHVGFALSSGGENLGFFTSAGFAIDALAFGPQSAASSEGRFPDGAATLLPLLPTPAAMNALLGTDSDADGMPDSWEIENGFDPGLADDAAMDADGDGMSNLDEYLAGTAPRDPTSRFEQSLTFEGGVPVIRFIARAGRSYTVLFSDGLTAWQRLSDVAPLAADGEVSVADPAAAGEPRRFYQIVTPALPPNP